MTNISTNLSDMKKKGLTVISRLLHNKHIKGSKTNERLNFFYSRDNVEKISKNLFTALDNREPYRPIYNINNIDEFSVFKEFCINLFKNDFRNKSNNIYSEIIVSRNVCQYCYVKSVNALDHYFEKDSFPELSVIPDNLIPICSNCNSKKNSKSINFVYPYYKILSTGQWLKCRVNADKTFKFYFNQTIFKGEFNSKLISDLHKQIVFVGAYPNYIISGQELVNEQLSNIDFLKNNTQESKEFTKKLVENSLQSTSKSIKLNHEFYKLAIYNGILENFDNIWNGL